MVFIPSETGSITGKWLYSDYYYSLSNTRLPQKKIVEKTTLLNKLSRWPLLGNLAGIARCALAIIHVIGHLLATLVTINTDHLVHAFKGVFEFSRGMIEAIPIIGTIFALAMFDQLICNRRAEEREVNVSFFLVKVYNASKLDEIDQALVNSNHITLERLADPKGGCFRFVRQPKPVELPSSP